MNVFTLVFVAAYVSQQTFVNGLSYSTYINDTSIPTEKSIIVLTPKQRQLVEEFRVKNAKILTDDYLNSDAHIVGWLRANKWNIIPAYKALKRSLAWRVANKIDALGQKPTPPKMLKLFPYRVIARNKEGCAVLEVEFGKWDVASYMSSAEFVRDAVKDFKEHVTQMWEKTRAAIKDNAKVCDQSIHLEDETGFSMQNLADTNALAGIINAVAIYETHYPNIFREILLGKAPADFTELMTILKATFSSGTFTILKIYSGQENSEFFDGILSSIHPSSVPPRYGGTRAV